MGAGSFKGHGYGRELLKTCEEDVAGTNGVVVMVGKKKLPYLSDKAFFIMARATRCVIRVFRTSNYW